MSEIAVTLRQHERTNPVNHPVNLYRASEFGIEYVGTGTLSDERPEASHGLPVLMIDGTAYGPADKPGLIVDTHPAHVAETLWEVDALRTINHPFWDAVAEAKRIENEARRRARAAGFTLRVPEE